MLLGYNTNGLQNHRLDDALRLLADHGFQAVALTPDVGHLDPFRSRPADVQRIAALLDRLALRPVMETGARFLLDPRTKHEPTLMTRDPQGRRRRVDLYRRVAEIGADLGASVLSFWSGVDRCPRPDSATWLLEGVLETVAAVREHGLVPALEPEPGMAVETVVDYRRLCVSMGSAAPALTLDIGHLYALWEGPPAEVIAASGPLLAQVHLEDMRWGEHLHRAPGTGDVDFGAILKSIDETGYGGPVCFELSRSSHDAPGSVAGCRELWNRAGYGASR